MAVIVDSIHLEIWRAVWQRLVVRYCFPDTRELESNPTTTISLVMLMRRILTTSPLRARPKQQPVPPIGGLSVLKGIFTEVFSSNFLLKAPTGFAPAVDVLIDTNGSDCATLALTNNVVSVTLAF